MPEPGIQQRSFDLSVRVVRLRRHLDRQPGTVRALSSQLVRAGTSVGANVEEAQAGQSRADFICKISIALKEARETCYWLRVLAASGVVSGDSFSDLQDEAERVKKILGQIVVSTKKNAAGAP